MTTANPTPLLNESPNTTMRYMIIRTSTTITAITYNHSLWLEAGKDGGPSVFAINAISPENALNAYLDSLRVSDRLNYYKSLRALSELGRDTHKLDGIRESKTSRKADILDALIKCNGSVYMAARILNISAKTLYRWMKELGIYAGNSAVINTVKDKIEN